MNKKRPNITGDITDYMHVTSKILDNIKICITAQMNGFTSR